MWAKESDVLQGWSRLWRPGRGADVFQWPARDGRDKQTAAAETRRLTGRVERFGLAVGGGHGLRGVA